jgi:alpha-L-arabinofuranosidase
VQELGSNETRAAAYVLLADVYKACGDSEAHSRLHRERLAKQLMKARGAVTVEVGGRSHVFHVGQVPAELSRSKQAIMSKLDEWSVWLAANRISNESVKCMHSEKLALAYAITQQQKHVVLRKNLRICSLCHEASKAITRLENITIHHWDRSRLHEMKNGECSCKDHY